MKLTRLSILTAMTLITAMTLTLGGCSTASTANPVISTSAKIPSYSETQQLNKIVNLSSIKLRIDSVSLIKNSTESQADLQGHLALGLEFGNISNENVSFHPDQIVVTTNTGEQLFSDTSVSGDIGGFFEGLLPPKRVLQGYVMFPLLKSNPVDINEIKLTIKAPHNEKDQPLSDDQELVIPIQHS